MTRQEHALLRSVIYASIFDYPLTLEQLHESLIGERADSSAIAAWYAASPALQAAIEFRDGYYFPRGRRDLLALRRTREGVSRAVLRGLHRPLRLVLAMPFVRMVALSGSLAHLNAEREADLDLFVVTAPGRVWSVTTAVLALARAFGWRRRLCLNYVVSERQLAVSPEDLFSANQIVHLRPLCGAAVYRRFLDANRFVTDYYPNFSARRIDAGRGEARLALAIRRAAEWILDRTIAPVSESICRMAYGWHLGRRASSWQSRDQVRLEPECLKLHTSSHRHAVMEKYRRAVSEACPPTLGETMDASEGRAERVIREAEVPARAAR